MPSESAAIDLRSINRLLVDEDGSPARYWIPAYQRGYRWDRLQVSYEFYLDEPEEPKDELIAILKGAGFEEKDGLTKDVKRSQALALARAFAQQT